MDFNHETFGNNLACGIVKKIVRRNLMREEAPEKLGQLYRSQCLSGKHIYQKPAKLKKGTLRLCQMCDANICQDLDSRKPPSCGLTNPKKLTYCKLHNYLCEYSTQAYNHCCHCILCNPRTSELLDYFNKIKSQLNLRKSNFKSKKVVFQIEF